MKTIEEKAKRLDEIIKKIRGMMPSWERLTYTGKTFLQDLTYIIPELKESGDEKFLRYLIDCCKSTIESDDKGLELSMDTTKRLFTWLEKQCEQEKSTKEKLMALSDGKQHLGWLDDADKVIGSVQKPVEPNWVHHEVDLSECSEEYCKAYYDGWNNCNQQHSQLKAEQTLDWGEDDEMKLNHIICDIESLKEQVYCKTLRDEEINWLKSLKDRVQPKHAWSEEDIVAIDCAVEVLSKDLPSLAASIERLKSLRPQNSIVTDEELAQAKKNAYNDALDKIEYHSGEPTFDDGWSAAIWYLKKRNAQFKNTWKPSEEQMRVLKEACDEHWEPDGLDPLYTLYQDLKKLREE